MIEWAGLVLIPFAGWVANKQLEVNAQVDKNTSDIEAMTGNVQHTRNRVDALYDHLVTIPRSRTRRGSEE